MISLKHKDFEGNIRETFKTLRQEEKLFDITLATDAGQHVQAHKMVLSAGSHFFNDIFKKTYHSNIMIYLKGISSAELAPVTNFLYNGESFISREYLAPFRRTANELQIKGILGELGDKNQKSTKHHAECFGKETVS